jgi:thioredoxin 1
MAAKFNDLINSPQPTLVDFTAEWCGPCKVQGPILKDIAGKLDNKAKIIKVDIDKNPDAASAYNIQGVPTLIIFRDGQIRWRQSGVRQAGEIMQELQKWM